MYIITFDFKLIISENMILNSLCTSSNYVVLTYITYY